MEMKFKHWIFVIGVLLAVLAGLVPQIQTPTISWILVILGLIVGFLNITAKETTEFLVATMALLLVGSAGALPVLGGTILTMLGNIIAFMAPAALIVSLKAIYVLAAD